MHNLATVRTRRASLRSVHWLCMILEWGAGHNSHAITEKRLTITALHSRCSGVERLALRPENQPLPFMSVKNTRMRVTILQLTLYRWPYAQTSTLPILFVFKLHHNSFPFSIAHQIAYQPQSTTRVYTNIQPHTRSCTPE